MEIEAKFLVLDKSSFQAIEKLSMLGNYSLSDAEIQCMDDTFLDTEDKAIMAAGYYLRVRKIRGKTPFWVTIKSLGGFEEGVHRREEYVCSLTEGLSIFECSDPWMRNLIFEFTAGMELTPTLALKQKRVIRQVKLGEKSIAELSLDRVSLKTGNLNLETPENQNIENQNPENQNPENQNIENEAPENEYKDSGSQEKIYCELEVELKKGASTQDLENIRSFLLEQYNLAENSLSKFERAFIFKEQIPKETFLNLRERAFCTQLAGQPDTYGKQAEILLAFDRGQSEKEISFLLKVSEPEIQTLKSRFKKEGLSIFPFFIENWVERTTEQGKKTKDFKFMSGTNLKAPLEKSKKDADFGKWTVEALFEYYGADIGRAKKAATFALEVYDELSLKGFGPEERTVLEFAVLLQNFGNSFLGNSASQEEKTRIIKEILLTHPLKDLKFRNLCLLFLVLELQNPALNEKTLDSRLKASDLSLSPGLMNKALMIATLIRTAEIFQTEKTEKKVEKKTALWREIFGTKILDGRPLFAFAKGRENEAKNKGLAEIKDNGKENKNELKNGSKKANKGLKFTIKPEDSMSKFAPLIFSYQFSRMLSNEKRIIQKVDPEALHNMRIAIRRMQAASKVFEAYLDSKQLEPHTKGLKKTLGILGEVRDLDVFQGKAENYLKNLPSGHEHELDPLFSVFAEEKKKARDKLRDYLKSEKYAYFKKGFLEFLAVPETWVLPTSSKKHEALPHRVKDILPSVLYTKLASINAYSEWVQGPYVSIERLHRLRIAAKGLRYSLEFFEDVLGKDAKPVIKEFKDFQDYLGNLHDSIVAIDMLEAYLRTWNWSTPFGPELKSQNKLVSKRKELTERKELAKGLGGVEAYLEYREAELQDLLNGFPDTWAKIQSREFKQQFEKVIESRC